MKRLKDITANIVIVEQSQSIDNVQIKSLVFDSRKAEKGDVFFAVRGTQVDGNDFVEAVLKKGVIAIVTDEKKVFEQFSNSGIMLLVDDAAKALSLMAATYYGNPSKKMKVVGVTGTNGKTTIATLLYNLFESLGHKAGLLSTVENYIHKTRIPSTHTTPDPIQIQSLMAEMVEQGCEYCFMEVSSHSIKQHRIDGIDFDGGVFTNITHDHLDYHKTFKDYLYTKKAFFDGLSSDAFALTNRDDANGEVMLQNTKATKKTYSLQTVADYKVKILETDFNGTLLQLNNNELWTLLIGRFNVYNILAVYGVADLLGVETMTLLTEISKLKSVKGRMDTLRLSEGKTALVDYAHTPDALKNVLDVLTEIKKENQTLITVFGAGGNRDKTKRPEMGKVAVKYSDRVVVTSDNPRFEEPKAIIDDILKGIDADKREKVLVVEDRKEAIRVAVLTAPADSLILIAGKGHEDYQEVKGTKYHFSDIEILETLKS